MAGTGALNALGKIGAKFSGEAGVTAGQEKSKDTGKMVETVELFVGGAGEVAAEVEVDFLGGISAG